MNFKTYYQSLTPVEKTKFALEAGTSAHYITTHLVYGRKIPKPKLLNGLALACEKLKSGITKEMLLNFFYSDNKSV
jgi:hypothetical protein